jgi:formylglycine-generating enzyme required for sulfatase activity
MSGYHRVRSAVRPLSYAALLVLSTAASATAQRAAPRSSSATAHSAAAAPYTETIPGTVVTFEMIPVPGGAVELRTAHGTRVEDVAPFWMGKVEVTWDILDIFIFGLDRGPDGAATVDDADSRPSKPYIIPGRNFGHQGRPALAMTHLTATAFAGWLSAKTGKNYRLPTEAEWEFACRAGGPDAPPDLTAHAWFWENADDRTHPGARLAPNAFGLHDMLGNVAEWVDGHDGEPVIKGGAFTDDPEDVHCAARRRQTPAWNATDPQLPKSLFWLPDAPFAGFRLLREP